MARLSKHGAELLRIEVEADVTEPDASTTWERLTRAYMADGKILEKRDVRFKPSAISPNGENYTWGWKLGRRQLKPEVNIHEHVTKIARKITDSTDTKWRIVSNGAPVVMISQARILAAVEADDARGFCKACGAEAYNVEPDARNYRCESCGQSEVYGAEEMLISA
jgi:hypothetical protein